MIVVVASINLDLIANVDRLPGPGETVPGSAFTTAPGGKGANQALAARRAGSTVRMVGAVGNDAFAGDALALLDDAGVDLSAVARVEAPTGTALILVGGDGENMIAVVPGANGLVVPSDLNEAFGAGDHVLLQHEIPLEAVAAAISRARQVGAISLLNTAPFHADAADLLMQADYVIANETEFDLYAEALKLSGSNRRARMEAFVSRTGNTLVVTLGSEGVVVATQDGSFGIPAMSITPVDTVGAGDTFCGYFAAGLDAGLSLNDAVQGAAIAGSLACLKQGAQPSIPLASDVDRALTSS